MASVPPCTGVCELIRTEGKAVNPRTSPAKINNNYNLPCSLRGLNYFIGKEAIMANFNTTNANIRLTNAERKSICSVNNVSPTVTAETAAAFVSAIETIYNNGTCTARISIAMDIVR